jgi:hypothetical protein
MLGGGPVVGCLLPLGGNRCWAASLALKAWETIRWAISWNPRKRERPWAPSRVPWKTSVSSGSSHTLGRLKEWKSKGALACSFMFAQLVLSQAPSPHLWRRHSRDRRCVRRSACLPGAVSACSRLADAGSPHALLLGDSARRARMSNERGAAHGRDFGKDQTEFVAGSA